MDLKVPYLNVTKKEEAFTKAKAFIPEVLEKFKLKADVSFDEAKNIMSAKGSGFDFKIEFQEKEAVVDLNLGFLLKPLKGKVLESIEKQIKKVV
jgi:hypothetical protein